MPKRIESIAMLKSHVNGVMKRAGHHAMNVKSVVPTLVGLIVWKANDIDGRMYDDKTGNMIWFTVDSGKRYAMIYNHTNESIEIREGTMNGNIRMTITNETTIDELLTFFESV